MDYDDTEMKPGQRIRLSALGKARCPRVKIHTGVIVGEPFGRGVRIILDIGRQQDAHYVAQKLH